VPVLLPNELFESINLILQFRNEIPAKNPYILGLPGIKKDIDISELVICCVNFPKSVMQLNLLLCTRY